MKKLYFMLVALLTAFAANAADYYLIGEFNGWTKADASCKFTEAGSGVYKLQYGGSLISQFKVNDGTWENDDINFGSNGTKLVVGTPYTYGTGGTSANIEMDGSVSNPTITLDLNAGTILVEGASTPGGGSSTPTGVVRAYWDNSTANWATPYIHYWGASNPDWPGVAMTRVSAASSYWYYDCPEGTTGCLFNAGDGDATKTSEFAAVNNHVYNQSGDQGEYSGENPGTDPGVDPTPGDGGDLYLVGEFNGWAEADGNYKFNHNGNEYTLTIPSLNGQFKIMGNTWNLSFGGDTGGEDVPSVDAVIGANTLWYNSSVNLVANNWTNVTLSFSWDGVEESITLNVTAGGSGPVVPVDPIDPTPGDGGDLYLVGEFNEWAEADGNYKFNHNGNEYTLTIPSLNGQFKIMGSTWDLSFGGDTGGEDVPSVDAVIGANTLWKKSSVNLVANNWTNVTLSFSWDGVEESITLNVTAGGSDPVDPVDPIDPTPGDYPATLYLIGHVNGTAWSTLESSAIAAQGVNGVYTYNSVTIDDAGAGLGYFSFITVCGSDWDTEVNTGDRYGAPSKDEPATPNVPTDITLYAAGVNASAAESWAIAPGTYTIEANLATMKVTAKSASGIEIVSGNNGSAEYFNLQGIRVDNPTNGIFIRRQGGTTTKVLVK